jgi:lactoylglutathione lyase
MTSCDAELGQIVRRLAGQGPTHREPAERVVSHMFKTKFERTHIHAAYAKQRLRKMNFKYAILYVDDVPATLDFFVRAFGLKQKMLHESGDYGELDTGKTTLAFSAKRLMRELGKAPGQATTQAPVFEIAFETDDVAASIARAVSAGATLIQDAREEPWGQTVAYVGDKNGFLIEICSPVRGAA